MQTEDERGVETPSNFTPLHLDRGAAQQFICALSLAAEAGNEVGEKSEPRQ